MFAEIHRGCSQPGIRQVIAGQLLVDAQLAQTRPFGAKGSQLHAGGRQQRVAYDTAAREVEIHQQVWMIEGVMEITVGEAHWRLEAGDCLAMRLDRAIVYRNPTGQPARYLVALATLPFVPTRKHR